MSPKYGRTEIKNAPAGAATPNGHIANKSLKVYLIMRKNERGNLHMVINFLLYKYNQNETALKLQPASLLYQRRKAALSELIAMDMKKNGVFQEK